MTLADLEKNQGGFLMRIIAGQFAAELERRLPETYEFAPEFQSYRASGRLSSGIERFPGTEGRVPS
jgi:hypothetical protein